MNTKKKPGNDPTGTNGGEEASAWASLDSLEGVIPTTRNWYNFAHRNFVLRIGTESNGNGGERYVFNHPTEWDARNNRPKRFRRNSKEAIENDARSVIDRELMKSTKPGGDAKPERQMEPGVAAPAGLSLEMLLDRLAPWLKRLPPEISPIDAIEQGIRLLIESVIAAKVPARSSIPELPAAADAPESKVPPPCVRTTADPGVEPPAPAKPMANDADLTERNSETAGAAVIQPQSVAEPPADAKTGKSRKSKVPWPPKHEFLEMLWLKRGTEIARELGCEALTVRKKADELGLTRPETMYWSRKKYGDPVEVPDHIKTMIARLRSEAAAVATSRPAATSEQPKPKSEQ